MAAAQRPAIEVPEGAAGGQDDVPPVVDRSPEAIADAVNRANMAAAEAVRAGGGMAGMERPRGEPPATAATRDATATQPVDNSGAVGEENAGVIAETGAGEGHGVGVEQTEATEATTAAAVPDAEHGDGSPSPSTGATTPKPSVEVPSVPDDGDDADGSHGDATSDGAAAPQGATDEGVHAANSTAGATPDAGEASDAVSPLKDSAIGATAVNSPGASSPSPSPTRASRSSTKQKPARAAARTASGADAPGATGSPGAALSRSLSSRLPQPRRARGTVDKGGHSNSPAATAAAASGGGASHSPAKRVKRAATMQPTGSSRARAAAARHGRRGSVDSADGPQGRRVRGRRGSLSSGHVGYGHSLDDLHRELTRLTARQATTDKALAEVLLQRRQIVDMEGRLAAAETAAATAAKRCEELESRMEEEATRRAGLQKRAKGLERENNELLAVVQGQSEVIAEAVAAWRRHAGVTSSARPNAAAAVKESEEVDETVAAAAAAARAIAVVTTPEETAAVDARSKAAAEPTTAAAEGALSPVAAAKASHQLGAVHSPTSLSSARSDAAAAGNIRESVRRTNQRSRKQLGLSVSLGRGPRPRVGSSVSPSHRARTEPDEPASDDVQLLAARIDKLEFELQRVSEVRRATVTHSRKDVRKADLEGSSPRVASHRASPLSHAAAVDLEATAPSGHPGAGSPAAGTATKAAKQRARSGLATELDVTGEGAEEFKGREEPQLDDGGNGLPRVETVDDDGISDALTGDDQLLPLPPHPTKSSVDTLAAAVATLQDRVRTWDKAAAAAMSLGAAKQAAHGDGGDASDRAGRGPAAMLSALRQLHHQLVTLETVMRAEVQARHRREAKLNETMGSKFAAFETRIEEESSARNKAEKAAATTFRDKVLSIERRIALAEEKQLDAVAESADSMQSVNRRLDAMDAKVSETLAEAAEAKSAAREAADARAHAEEVLRSTSAQGNATESDEPTGYARIASSASAPNFTLPAVAGASPAPSVHSAIPLRMRDGGAPVAGQLSHSSSVASVGDVAMSFAASGGPPPLHDSGADEIRRRVDRLSTMVDRLAAATESLEANQDVSSERLAARTRSVVAAEAGRLRREMVDRDTAASDARSALADSIKRRVEEAVANHVAVAHADTMKEVRRELREESKARERGLATHAYDVAVKIGEEVGKLRRSTQEEAASVRKELTDTVDAHRTSSADMLTKMEQAVTASTRALATAERTADLASRTDTKVEEGLRDARSSAMAGIDALAEGLEAEIEARKAGDKAAEAAAAASERATREEVRTAVLNQATAIGSMVRAKVEAESAERKAQAEEMRKELVEALQTETDARKAAVAEVQSSSEAKMKEYSKRTIDAVAKGLKSTIDAEREARKAEIAEARADAAAAIADEGENMASALHAAESAMREVGLAGSKGKAALEKALVRALGEEREARMAALGDMEAALQAAIAEAAEAEAADRAAALVAERASRTQLSAKVDSLAQDFGSKMKNHHEIVQKSVNEFAKDIRARVSAVEGHMAPLAADSATDVREELLATFEAHRQLTSLRDQVADTSLQKGLKSMRKWMADGLKGVQKEVQNLTERADVQAQRAETLSRKLNAQASRIEAVGPSDGSEGSSADTAGLEELRGRLEAVEKYGQSLVKVEYAKQLKARIEALEDALASRLDAASEGRGDEEDKEEESPRSPSRPIVGGKVIDDEKDAALRRAGTAPGMAVAGAAAAGLAGAGGARRGFQSMRDVKGDPRRQGLDSPVPVRRSTEAPAAADARADATDGGGGAGKEPKAAGKSHKKPRTNAGKTLPHTASVRVAVSGHGDDEFGAPQPAQRSSLAGVKE